MSHEFGQIWRFIWFFSLCTCWKKENTIASLKEEIPNSKNKVRRKELPFSLWITSWKQFQEIVSQTLLKKIINQLKHSLLLSTVTPHKSQITSQIICRKSLEGLWLPLRRTFLYIYILSQSIPTTRPNLKQIHYPASCEALRQSRTRTLIWCIHIYKLWFITQESNCIPP